MSYAVFTRSSHYVHTGCGLCAHCLHTIFIHILPPFPNHPPLAELALILPLPRPLPAQADLVEIERKYTPTTSDDEIGYVDLVIKVWPPPLAPSPPPRAPIHALPSHASLHTPASAHHLRRRDWVVAVKV
jgi:hypothetical protein